MRLVKYNLKFQDSIQCPLLMEGFVWDWDNMIYHFPTIEGGIYYGGMYYICG